MDEPEELRPDPERRPVRDIRPGNLVPFNGRQTQVTRIVTHGQSIYVRAIGEGFTIVWSLDPVDELEVVNPPGPPPR